MQTMKTVDEISRPNEVARLHATGEICACRTCGRDVRRNIAVACLAFSRRVRGLRTRAVKATLVGVHVVCSEMCARRLERADSGGPGRRIPAAKGWLHNRWWFHPCSLWYGALAFEERDHLIHDFHVTPRLKNVELPQLLYALTLPVVATIVKIRPETRTLIEEAKEAIGI